MRILRSTLAGALLLVVLAVPAGALASAPQTFGFHGGGYDNASAMTVDATGNVFIGGSVETAGSQATFAVVKLGPAGTGPWRRTHSGSAGGFGRLPPPATVDGAGNVYAAGHVGDGVIFNSALDYLMVKFGPDGSERWARRCNRRGNNTDLAHHVAVDGGGNVYVSGYSYGQGYDWATLKLSPAGRPCGSGGTAGRARATTASAGMALAPSGNLVVTGFTKNTGDGQTNDIETLTYDPQGAVVWRRSMDRRRHEPRGRQRHGRRHRRTDRRHRHDGREPPARTRCPSR